MTIKESTSAFGAVGLSDIEGLTRFVAELGKSVDFSMLPGHVQQRTKHCFLDTLGCALLGAEYEAARIAKRVSLPPDKTGPSTTLGRDPRQGDPTSVALINGIAAHVMDFDDNHRFAETGHPSSAVTMAALAVAEMLDASGAELLGAIVAGYETAVRIACLLGTDQYDKGFHTTGTMGTFSSAAATAHLLGLDPERWVMALGIAGTQTAGLRASFGTMSKSLHSGRAASAGVLAALLAQDNFTGAASILECEHGFAWTHTGHADVSNADRPLGAPYLVENVQFKYHAACFGTHDAIEAARQLRAENDLIPEDIDQITVRVAERSLRTCNIENPRTGLEAKFSLRFTVAAGLLGWDTDESGFEDKKVTDPAVMSIIDRITVEAADYNTRTGPSEVEITLKDGRRIIATSYRRNTPMPWPSLDDEWGVLAEKFMRTTHAVLGERSTSLVVDRIHDFDGEKSVRTFVTWLTSQMLPA